MADLCKLESVTVAFGGVKAVSNISVNIDDGPGITGVIGPNGAGKSTFLSVVAGARKPTAGRVEVMGHQLSGAAKPGRIARMGVARTFQIPRPFNELTIKENVMVSLTANSFGSLSAKAREADVILERLGLASAANNWAGTLPLASRKKLEVAKAMAIQPKLMLLDEVFEGLSDVEIQDMVGILRSLNEEGIRLVLVEHVLRALRQLASELIVFQKGEIIATGPVDEVLNSDQVKHAYLGFSSAAAPE